MYRQKVSRYTLPSNKFAGPLNTLTLIFRCFWNRTTNRVPIFFPIRLGHTQITVLQIGPVADLISIFNDHR